MCSVNIKLEKIELAKTLIDKLKYIHDLSACDHENIYYTVFENQIEEPQKVTKEFVDKYIIS